MMAPCNMAASSMSRSSSLSRSCCLDSCIAAVPVAAAPRSPALPRASRAPSGRKLRLRVQAQLQQPKGVLAGIRSSCSKFLNRYDPVTTGIGSLLVTGYCVVVHHQEVWEALNIAASATVLGMVMQEVLFNNDDKANENGA